MATVAALGLERRLRVEIRGEVLFDRASRGRYSTDASHYQQFPIGVVVPKSMSEAERVIAICMQEKISLTARGGGTSQCGQAINRGLILDCSRYLNQMLELDVEDRRCVVEPGIVLDDLNGQLMPHGLWFPIDVSTAARATIGGMTANNSCGGRSLRYGTMRDNVLSIDAILASGQQAHFGRLASDNNNLPDGSPRRPLIRTLLSIGARSAAEVEVSLPQGPAPSRRLQFGCATTGAHAQPRAFATRTTNTEFAMRS